MSKLKRMVVALLCVVCVGFGAMFAACDSGETSDSSSASSSNESSTESSSEDSSDESSEDSSDDSSDDSTEDSSDDSTSDDSSDDSGDDSTDSSTDDSSDSSSDDSTSEDSGTTASLTSEGGEWTLAQGDTVDLYVSVSGSYTITVDLEGYVAVWSDNAYSNLDEDTWLGDNYITYTTVSLSEGETITIEAEWASTVTITYNADEEDEGSSTVSTVSYAVNYSDSALQGYTLSASTTYYFAADGTISTTASDGIISYANYTEDKTVSIIKDSDQNSVTATVDGTDYTYALNTGGKTTSSRAYYEIDLSDYVGETVTIYAIFTSNSTAERSSMITTTKTDSTSGALVTATSSSQTDVQTISYTVTVSTTTTYYICASASINYYYVGVTIA